LKWLAAVLFFGVAIRHMGASWLAPILDLSVAGTFYVLGGVWEVVLCVAVILLLWNQWPTRWRWLVRAAMCIGVIEGAMMSGCRLAIKDLTLVPKGTNLCDHAMGLPVSSVLMSLYAIVLCWGAWRGKK
jgi:hypothetical protein